MIWDITFEHFDLISKLLDGAQRHCAAMVSLLAGSTSADLVDAADSWVDEARKYRALHESFSAAYKASLEP